ncbi:unnamed protein product [Cuscuta campestris]|uniref:Uncharacterized protein n=1 Tax=Cuscuta campestris TaxID=132261 RepID=A0A484MFY1_9ASTE|nr:unnamed protein product [Cuscuta campestris]
MVEKVVDQEQKREELWGFLPRKPKDSASQRDRCERNGSTHQEQSSLVLLKSVAGGTSELAPTEPDLGMSSPSQNMMNPSSLPSNPSPPNTITAELSPSPISPNDEANAASSQAEKDQSERSMASHSDPARSGQHDADVDGVSSKGTVSVHQMVLNPIFGFRRRPGHRLRSKSRERFLPLTKGNRRFTDERSWRYLIGSIGLEITIFRDGLPPIIAPLETRITQLDRAFSTINRVCDTEGTIGNSGSIGIPNTQRGEGKLGLKSFIKALSRSLSERKALIIEIDETKVPKNLESTSSSGVVPLLILACPRPEWQDPLIKAFESNSNVGHLSCLSISSNLLQQDLMQGVTMPSVTEHGLNDGSAETKEAEDEEKKIQLLF